jgi:nucleotide-binding universal stress UspA family protein
MEKEEGMRGTSAKDSPKTAQRTTRAQAVGVFHRLLVVLDGSDAAGPAREFARDWAFTFGAETRLVTLEERSSTQALGGAAPAAAEGSAHVTAGGHTLNTRNRTLVAGIAAAAEDFGADVIVLGCDHRRLARHRVGASLRERLARATELPVIVAPARAAGAADGRDGAEPVGASRHRVGARGFAGV